MTAACVCGWPKTECLRRVLANGPPFPPEPCEPKVEASSAATKPRWIVRYRAWVRLHKHWNHSHPWRQAWIDAT